MFAHTVPLTLLQLLHSILDLARTIPLEEMGQPAEYLCLPIRYLYPLLTLFSLLALEAD